MLNIGIFLKKPGESSYAQFRRLLLANGGIEREEFKLELMRTMRHLGHNTEASNKWPELASIAHVIELERLNSSEFSHDHDEDLIVKAPIKNCIDCAKVGYHTSIFDLPWIKVCPIHQRTLERCCNSCKQPWPAPSELWKRECECCGKSASLEVLRGGMNTKNGAVFDDIAFLEDILGKIEKRLSSSVILHAYTGPSRYPIDKTHPFYPSAGARILRLAKKDIVRLKKVGVPFFSSLECSSPLKVELQRNFGRGCSFPVKNLPRWQKKAMKQAIRSSTNFVPNELKGNTDWTFRSIRHDTNRQHLMTFAIWQKMFLENEKTMSSCQVEVPYSLLKNNLRGAPSPCHAVSIYSNDQSGTSPGQMEFRLPAKIQEAIYLNDARYLYFCVYESVIELIRTQLEPENSPNELRPASQYVAHPYVFYISKGGTLKMIFPLALGQLDFSGLKQICSFG